MKPREKLRSWFEDWRRPSGAYAMVVLCAVYETMMLTRLILAPQSANAALRMVLDTTRWGMTLFAAIIIMAVALLVVRRCRPLASLLALTALMFLTSVVYGSAYTYLLLPWIVCLYACTVETRKQESLLAGLLVAAMFALASTVSATLWHKDGSFTGLLYPTVFDFAMCVGLGLVSRTRREKHLSEQALMDEQGRSLRLAQERNQAVNQSRIAAELHDSVGHDLTAIIALSEGLDQATGKPETDDAIAMINDLARQGLADTRTAVRALQPSSVAGESDGASPVAMPSQSQGAMAESESPRHHWDDIAPILSHARQIGMTVALTETGHRPKDSEQAELSFIITREGITNAIRHGRAVSRIVISWDHDDKGAISIAVRDNGKNAKKISSEVGIGLNRLRETIQEHGGEFEAGPSSNGWTLRATIPSLTPAKDNKGQL